MASNPACVPASLPLLLVALALPALAGCSGLQQLAECEVDDVVDVVDGEELDGAEIDADEAKALVTTYSGTITWAGDAEEPADLTLTKAGPTSAVVFEDPDRCAPTYQFDVRADMSVSDDGRFSTQGALGSALVQSDEKGTLTLDVDLGEVSGIRLPDDFDPADYDEAWIEFKLQWDGEDLVGGGTWKGVGGDSTERASAGCCTLELSPQ